MIKPYIAIHSHAELVNRAGKWLKNFFHCRVVFTELVAMTATGETPDAIGWVFNQSILVECKANRSDYYADRKKRARHNGYPALGSWRFYLTPPGLLKPEEILDGWGLYEVHGRRIIFIGGKEYNNTSHPFESCRDSEIAMLLSAISRTKAETQK